MDNRRDVPLREGYDTPYRTTEERRNVGADGMRRGIDGPPIPMGGAEYLAQEKAKTATRVERILAELKAYSENIHGETPQTSAYALLCILAEVARLCGGDGDLFVEVLAGMQARA